MSEGYGTTKRTQWTQKMELDRRTRNVRRWLYNAKDDLGEGLLFVISSLLFVFAVALGIWFYSLWIH